jgi:hypothetical protein
MNVTRAPASNPNLITVIQHVIADALSSVHTAFPAQIEKYDYTTAKADVKPLINATYPDGSIMKLPVIPNVPIIWPRTSLGSISFPLQRGDGCLVICAERSLDEWLSNNQSEPTDPRMFDLNDAIAIPGLYSFASQTKITGSDKFEIHYKDQQVTIDGDGNIVIGKDTLDALVKKNFLSHTHTVNVVTTCPAGAGTGNGTAAVATTSSADFTQKVTAQ